ncbi:hypothetical protein VIGAN_04188500, partial [Vigna angularis var. angularis]
KRKRNRQRMSVVGKFLSPSSSQLFLSSRLFSSLSIDHSFFSGHSCHQVILLIDHSHSPSSSGTIIFVRRSIIFVDQTLGVPASNRGLPRCRCRCVVPVFSPNIFHFANFVRD